MAVSLLTVGAAPVVISGQASGINTVLYDKGSCFVTVSRLQANPNTVSLL